MIEIAEFDLTKRPTGVNPRVLLDSGPPRALYGVNPRLIFGKTWWNEVRKWAYKKYNNSCAACGAIKVRLEAHEVYKIDYKKGKMEVADITPLCYDCHMFIHQDVLNSMLKKGELKYSDAVRILAHGKRILRRAGIKNFRKDPNSSAVKPSDWRLVLNGVEYPPTYRQGEANG